MNNLSCYDYGRLWLWDILFCILSFKSRCSITEFVILFFYGYPLVKQVLTEEEESRTLAVATVDWKQSAAVCVSLHMDLVQSVSTFFTSASVCVSVCVVLFCWMWLELNCCLLQMHCSRGLSVQSLKSLGDKMITEQLFTVRDFMEAVRYFWKAWNCDWLC